MRILPTKLMAVCTLFAGGWPRLSGSMNETLGAPLFRALCERVGAQRRNAFDCDADFQKALVTQ
jgi:hypothetical protein